MANVPSLLRAFERFVALPWDAAVSGQEKVWFCIYEPRDEWRVRAEMTSFEIAARNAGHGWTVCDLSDALGEWLGSHEYRESYFMRPDLFGSACDEFREAVAARVKACLRDGDTGTLVALTGVASLFGVASVAELVASVAGEIRGRLAVFFPGRRVENNYRILDARDGWNYLAVPIEGEQ